MKKMSAFAKKLCAAVLSAVLIVGAMPAAVAMDDSAVPSGASDNAATPDEAVKPPEEQTQAGNDVPADPSFAFNQGANACYTDSDEYCFTGKSLEYLVVTVSPDSEVYSAIESDFAEGNTSNARVYLWYDQHQDQQNKNLDRTSDCQFTAENGVLKVEYDITNTDKDGLPSGDYIFKLRYIIDGNETELYNKPFHIANEAPQISNLKYDGEDAPKWSKSNVNITFDVDSDIIYSVSVNDNIVSGTNKSYTYSAEQSGTYTIAVKDRLGHENSLETPNVLIDKEEPSISAPKFYDDEDKELTGWYNKPATVKLKLSDPDSGVDKDSVTVAGAKVSVEESENAFVVSFKAEEVKDYKIECKDKAGNTAQYTVKKEDILLDTKAPEANDFTLSFSASESTGDKILNFLTFGLYANHDLRVSVNVSKAEGSDIAVDSIKLYNGKDSEQPLAKISGEDTAFLLKAPENDGEKVEYDIYAEATDKAGNPSGRISLTQTNVKTKMPDGTEVVQHFDADLFEIVLSKIVPDFGQDGVMYDFARKVVEDSAVYVAGNGTISVKVSEPVSGIRTVTATIDGKDVELTLNPEIENSKVTELTASFAAEDLADGEHEVKFIATANSGMTETINSTFVADNTAPVLDGEMSVPLAEGIWSNNDVAVTFVLSDKVTVTSVKYYNSTENDTPSEDVLKDADENDGVYTLTAQSYGDYTVLVEDALGNKGEIKTETPVRIDKENPEVVDGEFDYSKDYSNKPIEVTFRVKDNPEICSGIDQVTVDGKPVMKVSGEEDTYRFNADHYGDYQVQVSDKAGNYSETYTVGTIKFDDIKPVVKKFEFSAVKNAKDYGLYGNEALSVTVTVENLLNDADDGAELKKVELRSDDEVLCSEFTPLENNLYTLTYTITPDTKPAHLTAYAEDGAGNSVENSISDSSVEIFVDESAITNTKLSEIVITQQTPALDTLIPNFTRQQLVNGRNFYSGTGEFATAINDPLSGIDSYTTYFVKTEEVEFAENTITNLDKLTVQDKVENISKSTKQNSKSVKIKAKISDDDAVLPSGEYTAIIEAENLSGNSIVEYKNIVVDNTAPVITEVRIKTRGTNETINANGIYTAQPINIEISYDDGNYSAGISKVELFNGDNDAARIAGSDDGKFTVSDNGKYAFYGLVTDVFGNKLDKKEDLSRKKLFVNGNEITDHPDNFEIVISDSPEENSSDGIQYQFKYNNSSKVFKEESSDDGKITATIKNALVGLNQTDAKVTNLTTGKKEDVKVEKSDEETDDYNKLVSETLTVDAAGLTSGAYEVEFSARSLSGVKKSFTETFYVDKTAPVIESITYEKTSEAADKLLNLLTFGLYSNENIMVKVRVSDAAPSSGIKSKDVTLTTETGLRITEKSFEEVTKGDSETRGEYVKSFTLGVSSEEAGSFYSDLKAAAADAFENSSNGGFREFENSANGENFKTGEDFEIVSSTAAPVVSDVELTGENRYEKDGELWFSKGPKLTFKATDAISKIHSVKVILNDTEITNTCSYDAGSYKGFLPAEFTSFEAGLDNPQFTIPINNITVSVDTADSTSIQEGKNTVVISATGNNGVSTKEEDYTYTFYTDYSAPDVKKGSIVFENDADKVWTDKNVRVSFKVQDASGVGVGSVDVYRYDKKLDAGECGFTWDKATGECSFTAVEYGEYNTKISDISGNSSTTKLGTAQIDKSAPTVAKVQFAAGEGTFTQKDYGVYGNGTIKMTVTVDNDNAGYEDNAPLDEHAVTVTSKNSEKEDYIKFIGRTENTNEYVFEIHPVNGKLTADDFDIVIAAEDVASNRSAAQLSNKGVPVSVDPSLEKYDVIVTLNRPAISNISVEFSNDVKNDKGEIILLKNAKGVPVHSGNGTFSANVSDELSNLDKYNAYFVKTDELKFNDNKEITNLSELTPVASEAGISDSQKTKSKKITFNSTNPDALESENYTAIVEAFNLSGNSLVTYSTFIVDNTAPHITGITVTTTGKEDTVTDNGIFTAKPVTVSVDYTDGSFTAGVDRYELFNGADLFESNDKGTFRLSEDGVYQLRARVTDKFGNKPDESEDIKAVPITVTGSQGQKVLSDDHKNNFEIVINNSNDDTKFSDFINDYYYSTDTHICKNLDKDGIFKIVAENGKSGIKSNKVSIINKATSEVAVDTCEVENEVFAEDNPNKKIRNTIVANASALTSGTYEITFTVTDLGGIENSYTDVFYIDKTPAIIEGIRYEAAETAVDKLLNLLTFGLYANTDIKAVVTVSDASPSSGIKAEGIKLSSETGLSIKDGEFKVLTDSSPTIKGRYEKAFILGVSADEAKSHYSDLTAEVTDNFDNSSGNDFRNYKNSANGSEFNTDESFEIISSTIAPTVSGASFEGQNRYERETDKTLWFSKGPKFSFTAADSNSKIHSVQVNLNGTNVTNLCTYKAGSYKGDLPAEFTKFNKDIVEPLFPTAIENIAVELETSKSSALKEGKNEVVVTVTGNNGVPTKDSSYTYTFYTDYTGPVITDGSITFENDGDKVWTNKHVNVNFVANDGNGVGLDILEIFRNGEKVPREACNAVINTETGECSFTATEYGEYSAKLTDLNGNSRTSPIGTILIDHSAPEVDSVGFDKETKPFGVYSNTTIRMTVTIKNDKDSFGGNAPLSDDAVTVSSKVSAEKNNIAFKGRVSGTNDYVFDISSVSGEFTPDDFDILFKVSDVAGNGSSAQLNESGIPVSVDPSLEQYEIIATLNKPSVSSIGVTFSNDAKDEKGETILLTNKDGVPVHSGNGTFTAKITDALADVDRYNAYFVKTDSLVFNEKNEITNLGDFTPVSTETGISDTRKVKEKDVTFESTNKNHLESGNYTAIVEAFNLSGNSLVVYTSFIVDNTAPHVTGMTLKTESSDDTVTDCGVFTAKPVTVSIDCSDGEFSAGVATYELFNDDDSLGSNATGKFVISEDAIYHLRALVTDKFGNKLGSSEDLKATPITVTTPQVTRALGDSHMSSFEIVINNNSGNITFDEFKNDFHYHQNHNGNQSDTWIYKNLGSDGKFRITAHNSVSGIKDNGAIITDLSTGSIAVSGCTIENEVFADYNPEKKIRNTVIVNASNLTTGKYKITFTVTDLGGITNSYSEVFYIDKMEPEVENIRYESAETAADKLLNFLTFGLYANTDVKAIVTVKDIAPAAGINSDGIKLTSETVQTIREGEFSVVTTPTESRAGVYTKAFILGTGKDQSDSFHNDMQVSVKDIFENSTGGAFHKYVNRYSDGTNMHADGSFDIVVTSKAPDIAVTDVTGADKYVNDNGIWFSGQPTVHFTVTDNVSKIHAIEVKLNGENVTEYTDFGAATVLNPDAPGVFTDFSTHRGEEYNAINASINTMNQNVSRYVHEGKNVVTIRATGNNGNTSDATEQVFYYDTTKPVIQKFEFAGIAGSENRGSSQSVSKPEDLVEKTDYGYFFKDTVKVIITASDFVDDEEISGSGVKEILFEICDYDKEEFRSVTADTAYGNTAEFTVEANFKGFIRAYAIDNVMNNQFGEEKYNPDNVVTETESQHIKNSTVSFHLPDTSYSDNKGQRLYSGPIDVTIDAKSEFAGIQRIDYQVESSDGTVTNVDDAVVAVALDGTISGGVDSSQRFSDRHGVTNIVTHITKTLHIERNCNDINITVTITDMANQSSVYHLDDSNMEGKRFSIDTTQPHIEVSWDPAQGNQVANGDFYKVDRTATITVTERNFNPDDFKLTITNTDGSIPSLIPGDGWNTSYALAGRHDDITHKATVVFHNDGDYNMECAFTDLAGNQADNNHKKETEFTIDQTVPKISISFDKNNANSYYNETRTATIRIEEHNFIEDAQYLRVNQSATGEDYSTSTTPPSVGSWNPAGTDAYEAQIVFPADKNHDGKFSFTVDFKDKANNEATQEKASEFYIDTKINELEILNVEDLTAYDDTVAPLINYFDYNFAEGTYSLRRIDYGKEPENASNLTPSESSGGGHSKIVSYSDFARIAENDGIYLLNAHIKDKAGNEDNKDVLFSVNRFGSTFMIQDEKTKELVEELYYTNDAPDVVITEVNVNEISDPVVQVNRDDSTRNLEKGKDFEISQNSGGREKWFAYDYRVLKKNFESEGNYVVTVTSTDKFKNVVSNRTAYKETDENKEQIDRTCPVAFVVDKTAPVVTITGINSGEYYEEAAKNVIVNCDDANITSEFLKVEYDGQELQKDTDYQITSETAGNVEVRLELEADGKDIDRSFKVTISDKATNVNDLSEGGEVTGFRLSASWFARLLHYNLPIVIAAGGVLLAGIALAVILIVRKRGKKEE